MNCSPRRLIFAVLLMLCTTSIFGQATRTYIKSTGSDSNTATFCSDPLNPCRHFQNAHDNTAAGGAIVVLDTGFYGPLSITKAISVIANEGVTAGIVASASGNGVTVNAGSTDVVRLNNLQIFSGGNAGTTGIKITGGLRTEIKSSTINDCKYGIWATADSRVFVDQVKISGFQDGAGGGIGIWSDGTTTLTSTMKFLVTATKIIGGDLGFKVAGGGFWMNVNFDPENVIAFTTSAYNVAATAFSSCTTNANFFPFNGAQTGSAAAAGNCAAP